MRVLFKRLQIGPGEFYEFDFTKTFIMVRHLALDNSGMGIWSDYLPNEEANRAILLAGQKFSRARKWKSSWHLAAWEDRQKDHQGRDCHRPI